jgi:hypothetical protein
LRSVVEEVAQKIASFLKICFVELNNSYFSNKSTVGRVARARAGKAGEGRSLVYRLPTSGSQTVTEIDFSLLFLLLTFQDERPL